MRQKMKRFCLLTVLMSLCISIKAEYFELGGISYRTIDDQRVEVIKNIPYYEGDIVIPPEIENRGISYSVTSIGDDAFSYCGNLTSVTIPNSVTSIGESAFCYCGLTSVTIPNSVTSIGESAFSYCGLTSVTIPSSVISIGKKVFYNSGLTSVTIPNSVTSIGESAFSCCSHLTSVTIPSSVVSIGNNAFNTCRGMTSVTIENGVKTIGKNAFCFCSGLTSVTIPNSVTSIEVGAFYGCEQIKTLILGDNNTPIEESYLSVGNGAFRGCSNLTSIVIGSNVKYIGESAFSDCRKGSSITIYSNILELSGMAFSLCNIDSITFLCSNVGDNWFKRCSVKNVIFGDCVETIGNGAFGSCNNLKSVTIPNSVTSIGVGAFGDCSGLTSVTIGNSVTTIGGSAFSGCKLGSVTIPSSVTLMGGNAFPSETKLKFLGENPPITDNNSYYTDAYHYHIIEVPKGSSFRYASAENWEEADSIYAMDGKTILIPIGVKGENSIIAVNGNPEGSEVAIGSVVEVTSANNKDFPYSLVMRDNCDITNTIMRNGKYMFKASSNHKTNKITVYSYPYKDIKVSTSGTLIDQIGFDNIEDMECLKVSGDINGTDILTIRKMKKLKLLDLSDAHIVNGGMSYYENYTTSNNAIGNHFYDGLNELLRINLPNDIKSIYNDAFSGCGGVLTLRIPSSIERVGNYLQMLLNLGNNLSLQIEDLEKWCRTKFTNTGSHFYWCIAIHLFLKDKEIFDLEIPEGITSLSGGIFNGCRWLKSIKIPSSMEKMKEYTFTYCDDLTSVTSLNTTPPEITSDTFSKTTYENATLYVPKGSKTLYWLHPYWENFKNIVELEDSGVNDITVDPSPKSKGVYTISGVKLSANADNIDNLPKGIYIINGEKVIIK